MINHDPGIDLTKRQTQQIEKNELRNIIQKTLFCIRKQKLTLF